MVPKGLRVRLPESVMKSEYGERLRRRSENLFVKIHRVNMELAERKFRLNQDLGFTGVWIQKTVKWVEASLKKSAARVRSKLQQKLRSLRAQRLEEVKNTRKKQKFVKKIVVYNNSSKFLTRNKWSC